MSSKQQLMWTSNYQSSGILYNGSNSFDEDPVITECSRPVHRGSNVRTLNSPLRNSGESSEGEFVEEEKPWPPEHGVRNGRTKNKGGGGLGTRVPRPHSHLFMLGGRARASRHSRRWANCKSWSLLWYDRGITVKLWLLQRALSCFLVISKETVCCMSGHII